MKITKKQLRRIIQEELLRESYAVDISAMTLNKPAIADWVDLLIDELEPTLPQLRNLPEKHHDTTVRRITDSVFATLADSLKAFAPHVMPDRTPS
tara:strand:- start:4805 stop:5089 length:285 start_codon:yes stop_codon:yes gene_type:complete